MRATNVIIISSGRVSSAPPLALDKMIRSIVEMKKRPVLVLGPDGDDVLGSCAEIEKCELVFDPNYTGGFFSSLKAGLHAIHGATLVVPLDPKFAADDGTLQKTLGDLENSIEGDGTAAKCDVVCPLTHDNATRPAGEPFLVTQKGVKSLMNFEASLDWENCDAISVQHVPVSSGTNC